MTTTTVYITRHGQTEWNVQGRMQGHLDSELTELGVRQAQWLGDAMRDIPLDAVYASPSARAVRTASLIVGDRNLDVHPAPAFMEMGFGEWEGRLSEELSELYPEQHGYLWGDPDLFVVKGAETFAEVSLRARVKLEEIVARHAGQTVLIVTHTVVIKVLMAYLEGRSSKQLWDLPYIHPTCLCRVDYRDGVAEVKLHGDISHYRTEEQGESGYGRK